MRVTVAYALPDEQFEEQLELPDGACVADALAAVADLPPFTGLDLSTVPVGVFNQVVSERSHVLEPADRVEIYRPLTVDPMSARQQRAAAQKKQPRQG